MRTAILERARRAFQPDFLTRQSRNVTVLAVWLSATINLLANPVMSTLGGGNPHVSPKYLGFKDGTTLSQALFHTPSGIALDSTGQYLFVADRDNNAIRTLDLVAGQTFTFTTNHLSKPISVSVDASGNVYVLNRGSTGNNGYVLQFNQYGDLILTNTSGLTNAGGMALDSVSDIYVTVSNTVLQIIGTTVTNIATVPIAGTSLQGLVVKRSGLLAVCDAGRNGILLIDPLTGVVTTNTGFNGQGDYTGVNNGGATRLTAKFYQPYNVAEAGDGSLIVVDRGNNRIKVVSNAGITTNLCGVASNYWGGTYPGWYDGTVLVPDSLTPNVQERMPTGVAFFSDGTIYVTEDYYHTIRKVTGAGLPQPPPPPPQVPDPQIGWVSFPPTSTPYPYTSVFNAGTSFVFNNSVYIVIEGTAGSQTYYTYGATPTIGTIPDPTRLSPSAPVGYMDGLYPSQVAQYAVASVMPDLTIKAIGEKSDGSPNSAVVEARFQFVTANPLVIGNNAALFTVSDITSNCVFWYTIDGFDPTNIFDGHSQILATNSPSLTNLVSLPINTNFTLKVRAFRDNFQPSGTLSVPFSTSNFVPNSISFGFYTGEASSDFIASPGQTFYAPVTLSPLQNTVIYSLQFNLTVTNGGPNPGPAITPGAYDFVSMLVKPIPGESDMFEVIPPWMYEFYAVNPPPPADILTLDGNPAFISLITTNLAYNLLGVGWLERYSQTNLYNTKSQDLIQYSMAHDNLFQQGGGKVILGGFNFSVPVTALPGQTYQIQIGRPSATSDGIGAPGSSVYIFAPTNGSLGAGSINAIKNVTIGQRKYLVGNAYPFRWFNAGDFGNTNLQNADVEQVFESAIYGFNYPPDGSDFFDTMDSCGRFGVYNAGTGYYTSSGPLSIAQQNALFNGNDTTINSIAFGDGNLDICDVYVTYRRSLDPTLTWYQRFWTNGVRVAETVPNVFNPSALTKKLASDTTTLLANYGGSSTSLTNQPKVVFVAGDFQATAGQTVQIPITASIFGNYPLRLLMLNLNVVPLDGSPALTTPVSFSYNPALGSPWTTDQVGNGNFAAVWLNNGIAGLSGNVTIGTLTVTIPANATSACAYAIHFDHVSASPNGLAAFPKSAKTGLITLANRTTSSYGDGIPDAWRLRYFLTLNNLLSQTNADADGDGVDNLHEYQLGTDPTDPASFFKTIGTDSAAAQSSQDCVISWPSVIGKQYVIERSPSLSAPTWSAIGTNNGNGTVMEYHDTTGGSIRFYRVRVP
ncbi:MAG TPA: NHL repeat-containing protein [Candidatus Acidoferrum sp.]|nr:NHL repeat-containing protein [Candidatus Acidoferrum sp.]